MSFFQMLWCAVCQTLTSNCKHGVCSICCNACKAEAAEQKEKDKKK